MTSTLSLKILTVCAVTCAVVGITSAHQGQMTMHKLTYAKVAPLIKAECMSCHNAARHPEKVDLSSYQALMQSGEHGPIVIAGQPGKSKLIMYIDGEKQPRMPFKKKPLSAAQIALLKKWISAGAKG